MASIADVPFGDARSYGQLARLLSNPQAMRAVVATNGKNPISIVVPCHGLIGASGEFAGFAGRLKTKAPLLELESDGGLLAKAN
jgi:methylated-DNA-[protein]-cysteine S-methyltransferase